MMKIPYRDLSVKDKKLKRELLEAVDRVLSHGRIILGPEVTRFEEQLARYCQKKYAVGLNSGTDALYLALRALDIKEGDEVITTPLSWVATLNAIVLTGATPVFVDIGKDLNINAGLIEKAITPKTRAILPVHFTGKLCEIERIVEIAKKHHIDVVEDVAQAFGAHRKAKMAGSFGRVSCFSLNPMKVLCAYGEAGAVVTDDKALYEKMCSLRYAGTVNKEDCQTPSLNGRIDTLQAAMLSVNMKYVDEKIKHRREIAGQYTQGLSTVVKCPDEDDSYHVYYSYTIVCERRDALKEFLMDKGVETKIQHPILMPYHRAYRGKYHCRIPVAEEMVQKILCLPNEESLTEEQIEYVITCIKKFYETES